MNQFLVFLVLAYARSEKLDLTYLPPPGSQYAGGSPGDIQVPLEFPKETYTTTLRPQDFENGVTNPEDYQATIGINRGQPSETIDSEVTQGTKAPFSYLQNTNRVPTTTVSYAFTQTTTHPPTEGYETTIGPQFSGTDYPSQDGFNFQPQKPSLTYQGNDQQLTQLTGRPPATSVTQYPGHVIQSQGPAVENENQLSPNRPYFQQNVNQFAGQRPIAPISGSVSQFTGSTAQPPVTGDIYQEDLQTQNRPGFKPTGNQYVVQNPTLAPTTLPVNRFFNTPTQNIGQNFGGQRPNNLNQQQSINRGQTSGARPGAPFGQNQTTVNQPGLVPSTTLAPSVSSTIQTGVTYGDRVNLPGAVMRRPDASQSDLPVDIGAGQNVDEENIYQQQYPGYQVNGEQVINGNRPIYRPSSTIVPTTLTPGSQNIQFPAGASATSGSYSTPDYPGAQYNNQIGGATSSYSQRPERPQAEADRNAVILNYENVITPEGFAYTFDTSNGIHADESGTATDGVKAKGSYSYVGDDGKLYTVVYTADENGYQPHGDHLPTPPPIPEAIQEIIEKAKKEKEAGIYHDGSYDDDKYGYKNYQGAMRYRPQSPKKQIIIGADVPEEYVTETTTRDMRPQKPQTGTRKPIVSSGDLTDFDVTKQEQNQYDDDKNNEEDVNVPGQISTQRPINRVKISGGDEKEQYDNTQDNGDQNKYIEVSSKRPLKQPTRQQSKTQSSKSNVNNKLNSDKKRPVSNIEEIDDQTPSDYELEEPYDSNTRISNKVPARHPSYKQRPQYNQEGSTSSDSFEYDSNSKRPLTPSRERPMKNKPENTNERVYDSETSRPADKLPGRRPMNRPIIGNVQNKYTNDEEYITNNDEYQPSEKPYEYSNEDDSGNVTTEYKYSDYVTRKPSRPKPDGTKISTSRGQSTRRRPVYGSQTPSTESYDIEYQPEDDEIQTGSQGFEIVPSQKYASRRPIAGKPTKISGGQNEETEQKNIPENGYENILKPTFSAKYDKTRIRPQNSRPRDQQPSYNQNNRGQMIIGDTKSPSIQGTKYGQKINRPTVNRQNVRVNIENQSPTSESGYQYMPPQRKFEQDEIKRFPVKNTGTTSITSTGRPSQDIEVYGQNIVKAKPFITPNVYRDEENVSEDDYDQEVGKPEIVSGIDQKQDNYDGDYSQNPDSVTAPEQIIGDEIISSTKRPYKIKYDSTYAPFSTTTRPSKAQYDQNQLDYVNNVAQKGNRRPIQSVDHYNGTYTKVPHKGVSSTTPLPSTRLFYGSTYVPTTTEEQNDYITGITQTPGQGIISSTTPLSSRKPSQGSYQQTYVPQYQTTIRPGALRPTTEYIDGTTAQGFPDVSSTYAPSNLGPSKNGQYGSNLPSTTYRPNYTITGTNEPSSTSGPGVVVDGFGRPIRPGYSSTIQDRPGFSSSTQDYFPGQPIRSETTDVRYKPDVPSNQQFREQQRYRPGLKTGQQEVTSAPNFQTSTQKIIGEDFSGPKQQQKYDPETGYYY